MFKQFTRKFSSNIKTTYSPKEYINLYINNSKDSLNRELDMQNKIIVSTATLLFTGLSGLYLYTDKRFEQVDKRFEHLESEVKDIKNTLNDILIAIRKK